MRENNVEKFILLKSNMQALFVSVLMMISAPSGTSAADPDAIAETAKPGAPRSSASVYWVGHSLMEATPDSVAGPINMMTLVGKFAEARRLNYNHGDHTLWGSPLSALWRGKPHSYERDASAMAGKRETFQASADSYDTLILTDVIPVRTAIDNEYSAYYARRFYCTLKMANPQARVFLYQTWVHLQGSDQSAGYASPDVFDWRMEMTRERLDWEALAEAASNPNVEAPSWHSMLWDASSDAGCRIGDPIHLIPVGAAMVALADRIDNPRADDKFTRPDGAEFAFSDLFRNPYVEKPGSNGRTLRHPEEPHDDIHPSAEGVYFIALVHFSAIYGQSPVGLPDILQLGQPLVKTLQCIAWEAVVSDAKSGLTPANEGGCK